MVKKFKAIFQKIFEIPDFFREPFLTLGYYPILENCWASSFNQKKIKNHLTYEKSNITILDLFDPRAQLRYDLNVPVPTKEHEKYQTVMDYGTLEHIFDTKQCLENNLKMVKVGGLYFLHTPVRGYFKHGFHTFNPELILSVLKLNNFEIVYSKYSTRAGEIIGNPHCGDGDGITVYNRGVLIWIVAKKLKSLDKLIIPQQGMWNHYYDKINGVDK